MMLFGAGEFKSFEDYRCITNTSTKNYEISHSAYPNELGLMTYNGYICVALGSYYGNVGDIFKIQFEDGQTIEVIKADGKADKDTINNAVHKTDGSIVEFIVDMETLDKSVMISGDVGTIYEGGIVKIWKKQ